MAKKTLLFILASLLFISFVLFSYLVAKNHFSHFDFDTTVKMQDHISRIWDLPFSLFSLMGSAEITGLIWLGIFIFIIFKRYFLTALSLMLMPLALLIELYGKIYVYHPSPPYLFYRGAIKFDFFPSSYVHTNYSYPSGHLTRTAFLVFFSISYLMYRQSNKKVFLQLLLLFFLVIMAISRIYLAEHWTSDVIGGTLIGSSCGILSALTLPRKRIDG